MDKIDTLDPTAIAVAIIILTSIAIYVYYVVFALAKKIGSTQPTVRELNIYPIKSCAEIQVDSAVVTPRGFENDRIFQVVYKDYKWKYATPRNKEFGKLFHIKPTISDDGSSLELSSPHTKEIFTLELEGEKTTTLTATVMGDSEVTLDDYGGDVADWLCEASGIDTTLVSLVGIPNNKYQRHVEVNPDQGEEVPSPSVPVSLADEAPFLLTTQESLSDLNRRLELAGKDMVDMRRFRPNIVIGGLQPWEEDSLKRIKIGTIEFHVWQRCGRCTMTTIDRDTLQRSGEPLTTLSSFRERKNGQRNFGMHLIPALDGLEGDEGVMRDEISVGDTVEILEYDEERRAEWERLFGSS